MDEFGYIWEVFALLIGLALAEMLGGFSRILKLRARRKAGVDPSASSGEAAGAQEIRIGWLVPLLGLLVLVDLATFFNVMWTGRAVLDMQIATVLGVLVLIGGYYLISTLVFPDEPELWPDFDVYYRLQKRYVVWGMLAINLAAQGALVLLGAGADEETRAAMEQAVLAHPWFALASLVLLLNYPAFAWLALSKRRRVDMALMLFIILSQFFVALAAFGLDLPAT